MHENEAVKATNGVGLSFEEMKERLIALETRQGEDDCRAKINDRELAMMAKPSQKRDYQDN